MCLLLLNGRVTYFGRGARNMTTITQIYNIPSILCSEPFPKILHFLLFRLVFATPHSSEEN